MEFDIIRPSNKTPIDTFRIKKEKNQTNLTIYSENIFENDKSIVKPLQSLESFWISLIKISRYRYVGKEFIITGKQVK